MKRPQLLIVAASLALAHAAVAAPVAAGPVLDAANPFARPSTLPLHYPAFDKIKDEHFMPAFEAGMREQLREVAGIAANKRPPSFDNTIVALERSGQLLTRVGTTFSNLQTANTNDKLDAIDREIQPKLAAHHDAIYLNDKLWARVKALYDKRASLGLDAESMHLLERYHRDFVRAGARLGAADKEKLKAYNGEIAALQSRFSQNTLKEANASAVVVDTRAELDGLSNAQVDAAAAEAKKRGLDGKFVLVLGNTTGQAALAELTNRAVRERLLAASLARGSRGGEFDNRELVLRLVKLRAEKAALLGYPNFAAYSVETETAKNPEAINKLLADVIKPAEANAHGEAAEIQKVIDAEHGGFQAGPQDWSYYTDKVRSQKFAFDESQLKPYFELNNVVLNGVFYAANKEFGISFKERHDLPVYDPDVRTFDVFDADGKQLAIFILDYYARPNKQGGAWENEYVSQSKLLGTYPVVANHLNIPKPPAGQPTLLTFDEVTTAFHEFGHALHSMFSNVKYPTFAGANTARDFVEYPSQQNEMWATWPEVLAHYAKHYQTGASMPKDLLDKVLATKTFNMGFITTEYTAAAILDQRWHQLAPSQIPTDVPLFESQALKNAGADYEPVPPRYRTTYFSHSFSLGYSAGYYAYLWSEKLAADTSAWFKENGGLLRKNGDYYRKMVLSRGSSQDELETYHNFRGRDADIKPLLLRRGLAAE
ncbi:M3 family metallopeptidase [Massilia solisilvae]|uniref:M3 family metallopeptidase n=1 Tax=Massilia solisilvae TaxID=1811225 RepID=A0ABT2BP13_9BURK|nr:M3 family metallopeptidase [Massilia solisilvae]MCS0610254.1 M3 family metallopeptidase [Massilia solisilvae]